MNDTNELWKDLFPYQLNLMLNSNQGLALFRQIQTLSKHKYLPKHNEKNNKFSLTKEILTQFFLNVKPNSTLALVILIFFTLSHPILSLINVL